MKYKTTDGLSFMADTPEQTVTALRESSKFDNCCTNKQYMDRFAERYNVAYGIMLDTSSPEQFMAALMETGYLSIDK